MFIVHTSFPFWLAVERFGFPLARGFRFSAACPRLWF
nr:MAG TPA: hypothetical protein [Caudoviricetes sp.]